MALPLYLALTAAEMAGNSIPPQSAYMACHFSPCGKGLSNLPPSLPPGAMLILDDSTPMAGHDPELILKQLSIQVERLHCESILLDFQRPDVNAQRELAKLTAGALPCPVGVSELYAGGLPCPVFLPPVPPDKPPVEHLKPWQGREIWLEAALEGITLTLTEGGCSTTLLSNFPEDGQQDRKLHCHYTVEAPATFHIWRNRDDLDALLAEAKNAGVTRAIGLWQELGR